MSKTTFKDKFMKLIRAGQPAIFITTHEEERCIDEIRMMYKEAIANQTLTKKLAQFKITNEGIYFRDSELPPCGDCDNPMAFTDLIKEQLHKEHLFMVEVQEIANEGSKRKPKTERSQCGSDTTFLLPDFHHFFRENYSDRLAILRRTKDIVNMFGSVGNTLVVIAPSVYLPEDIEKEFILIDYDMPSEQQIEAQIIEFYDLTLSDKSEAKRLKAFKEHFQNNKRQIVNAFKGLTAFESQTALAIAVADELRKQDDCKGEVDIREILSHKAQTIKKSGIVEWVDADIKISSIGGLEVLKEWIAKRTMAFSQEAIDFGVPQPRGVLLLGCSGTGKSMAAKAMASALSLPMIRVDMGKVFGSLVGESEKNINEITKLAESIAPCVLQIDEFEKGFAGANGSGGNDGGTTKRVVGLFLTWMQERKASVFVCATANDISALPPELYRKGGRFDEIFFVDYPHRGEREAILRIQIEKICQDKADEDIDYVQLSKELHNYTGAEIQSVVDNAMTNAFYDGSKTVTNKHILTSINETMSLADSMSAVIEAMRSKLKGMAKSASLPEEEVVASKVPFLPSNNARKLS